MATFLLVPIIFLTIYGLGMTFYCLHLEKRNRLLNNMIVAPQPDFPQECVLCGDVIRTREDAYEGHGIGDCVEPCWACECSGYRPIEKGGE